MLVGPDPKIMRIELGASGCYSYEIMDTCRPAPDMETGDADTSLLSYLDCLVGSYAAYREKVDAVDILSSFQFFAFHTPFAGMVRGAHRKLMRENSRLSAKEIDEDFHRRAAQSLVFCSQVGNVYSATTYLALCSLVERAAVQTTKRVGIFSYGSGCSSEFYSGLLVPGSGETVRRLRVAESIGDRLRLSMEEYDLLLDLHARHKFGVKDLRVETQLYEEIYRRSFRGRGLLKLSAIEDFRRIYEWC